MQLLAVALLATLPAAAVEDYPLPQAPPPTSSSRSIDFSADHVDYVSTSSVVHLKGRVRVRESSWTIKADELWLDTVRRLCSTPGFMYMDNGTGAAACTGGGTFDFTSRSGEMRETSAGYGYWRVHAPKGIFQNNSRADYYGANLTSCDYPVPHYHLHSSRLTVVREKYLLARNAVFYLGKAPIFYFPLFYKNISPQAQNPFFQIKAMPGYNARNGAALNILSNFRFRKDVYARLRVSGYSLQGVNVAAEFHQHQGSNHLFDFLISGINEKGTNDAKWGEQGLTHHRWAMIANAYQRFKSGWAFQSRIQHQSDPRYLNDYMLSGTFMYSPYLLNSASLFYTTNTYVARLSYNNQSLPGGSNGLSFFKVQELYQAKIHTAPLRFKAIPWWVNTFTAKAESLFNTGPSQQSLPIVSPWYATVPNSQQALFTSTGTKKYIEGAWDATRTFFLGHGLRFRPSARYQADFYNQALSPTTFGGTAVSSSAFVGRYHFRGDLRWNTAFAQLSATELYAVRQKANSFATDSSAADGGVEANVGTLEAMLFPARGMIMRLIGGYNFQNYRSSPTMSFQDRLEPAVFDLTYMPRNDVTFTLHDAYLPSLGNQSFIADAILGVTTATFVDAGAAYSAGDPTPYTLNLQFGYKPSTGPWRNWQVLGILRASAETPNNLLRIHNLALFDKELSIIKQWHDFETRLIVMYRPAVETVKFLVTLRFGPGQPPGEAAASRERNWEGEWFPDRITSPDRD